MHLQSFSVDLKQCARCTRGMGCLLAEDFGSASRLHSLAHADFSVIDPLSRARARASVDAFHWRKHGETLLRQTLITLQTASWL